LAAGLISFIVDGSRTILFAGTRSAGKTSLLAAMMTEIMRKYRVITIEDTLELPVDSLRKLGYNIQSMKVAAAMTRGTTEVAADEGIRTTLRMGDSCLIVGEVRSVEALALYEAMRVGALANVVAGTIHGDSPYGVFDRVVNDLKVPRTSFKATDIIIVANPIKSPDGLHRWRRVTQITEVRKYWENDPLLEAGFSDLMKYDPKTDMLEPSKDIINGDSDVLKAIAGNVKEWASDWDAVWSNIMLRADIKKMILDYSIKLKMPEILEAGFVINANDEFHNISNKVEEDIGSLDSKRILSEWEKWLKKELKKKKV
ncbi:MAG: CpaF/VirB11 family protein, partial [Nanoarchaeota archaeon]|nr:CpaF/VirB11 family protein [Nanoarchaeota archaeon]